MSVAGRHAQAEQGRCSENHSVSRYGRCKGSKIKPNVWFTSQGIYVNVNDSHIVGDKAFELSPGELFGFNVGDYEVMPASEAEGSTNTKRTSAMQSIRAVWQRMRPQPSALVGSGAGLRTGCPPACAAWSQA